MPDYGPTLYNSEADDDDCKYHVKFTATPIRREPERDLHRTATTLADGAAGDRRQRRRRGVPERHPPRAELAARRPTRSRGGMYDVGPIKFDAAGRWTVRFHLHEDCQDATETHRMDMWPSTSTFPDGGSRGLRAQPSVATMRRGLARGLRGAAVQRVLPKRPATPAAPRQPRATRRRSRRSSTCAASPAILPGGQEASRPLQTYSQVYSERSAVLNQVYACNMPPGTARSRRSRSGRRS